MGGFMINENDIKIAIDNILQEEMLPIRIINILKSKQYKNIEEFYQFYEELLIKYTSYYLFPNHFIEFYPQITKRKAKNNLTCDLSGQRIFKGSEYYTYHPFMEDLFSGDVYIIKKEIKVSCDYVNVLPRELLTYELWYCALKDSFDNNLVDNIDLYNLSVQRGDNCLYPYALGRSKKRKNNVFK
jgi:hypothetical protein